MIEGEAAMTADQAPENAASEEVVGDEELITAWREHRVELRANGERSRRNYISFESHRLNGSTSNVVVYAFRHQLADLLSELIGSLNVWQYTNATLIAWTTVLSRQQGRQLHSQLLLEFIDPLADGALGAPYRVKQNLIFAACRALEFLQPDKPPLDERAIKYRALKKLATGRPHAEALLEALDEIDSQASHEKTYNFRHRFQHRVAPGLEVGLRTVVNKFVQPGGVGFDFGVMPPLLLADAVPELEAEHVRAVGAFGVLWTLVRQIESELKNT